MRHCPVAAIVLPVVMAVASNLAEAQGGPTVRVEQTTLVSAQAPAIPHAEPFVAVSGRDPRQLLAAAIAPGPSSFRSAVYRSTDAGRSWSVVTFDSARWAAGVDPIVYFDAAGTAFFSALSGGFPVLRSPDGGATWERPIQVPGGGYDREYLAFDATRGPYSGRVYAAGTLSLRDIQGRRHAAIAVSTSQDGGRTFASPRIIMPDSAEEFWTIADPVVLPSGRVLIAVASVVVSPGGMMMGSAMRGHVRVITSDDGASTFSAPVTVADFTNSMGKPGVLARTTVRAVADTAAASPLRGNVYLTWPELVDGRYDIVVARSSDDGRSWRTTRPVDAGTGHQTNPALAVNNAGMVALLWNDRRESGESSCFAVRAAASADGGEHFGASTPLSTRATCPESADNWTPIAMSFMNTPMNGAGPARPAIQITALPMRFLTGGETQGLVASPDGSFHALWLDGSSGVMQLRWSRLAASGTVAAKRDLAVALASSPPFDALAAMRIEVEHAELDFVAHTLSVRVRVANPTKMAMATPIDLVIERLSGALEGLRATDADNAKDGATARWRLSAPGGAASLHTGERTDARTLHFSFSGGPPAVTGALPALLEFSIRRPEP
jgi:hypothetical protein